MVLIGSKKYIVLALILCQVQPKCMRCGTVGRSSMGPNSAVAKLVKIQDLDSHQHCSGNLASRRLGKLAFRPLLSMAEAAEALQIV